MKIKRILITILVVICSLFFVFSCDVLGGEEGGEEYKPDTQLPTCAKPEAETPSGSSVASGREITLSCSTTGADIYWYVGTAMPPYTMSDIDSKLYLYTP